MKEKSWFAIEGTLEPINTSGPLHIRFPRELSRWVIEKYTRPGDTVIDPFCGWGTSLSVAQELGRVGIGIESAPERAAFAASRLSPPSRVVEGDAREFASLDLPRCQLVFCGPPYFSMREGKEGAAKYYQDLRTVFVGLSRILSPGGRIVLDMSNFRGPDGVFPVAWLAALQLAEVLTFHGETIRCNSGSEGTGAGFDHSYLLEFSPR